MLFIYLQLTYKHVKYNLDDGQGFYPCGKVFCDLFTLFIQL